MKIENSLTFLSMPSHDDSSAIGVRKPVSTTQQQADAVDADVVVDAERRNPRRALDELERRADADGRTRPTAPA